MAGLKRDANIFKVLDTMKDALDSVVNMDTSGMSETELAEWTASQRRFVFDGEDIRQSFVSELEDFLFSCEWTTSDRVREIVGYLRDGVPLNQIGDLVGLKNSAFRMRMSRMTDTINEMLFDGRACSEGVYSLTDLGAVKRCLLKLRLVRDPIRVREEFSLRQTEWIKGHIEQVDSFAVDKSNLDKYFRAVLFLALTSRSFTLNFLDDIDPSALGYAFNDMQSDGVNSTKLLFTLLLKRLSPASVSCKEELLDVKREYQDYMRG